ncbi:PREDICTED: putative pirin-like protein At3g59260 [Camelina sativa]|uniref:Pirin-like protein At3g59260 n=1 Tax=Camelina sativa TaxID=90675 RepID=A0ABM0VIS2_CAMSA|nr:PREDICTED: putative pirin-like protein At3g59260 [Camelina sativa]
MSERQIVKMIYANFENDGGAAAVIRQGITKTNHELLDPFVSLVELSFSPPGGFRDHPHRGFESVTYMLQGGLIHQDCNGHQGTIQEGDVQWTTAGRGLIHSEMPQEEVNSLIQLWINLPSSQKMIWPKNREIPNSYIRRAWGDGVEVKIIAGKSMGVESRPPYYTETPIMFLDITLDPTAQTLQTIPESWTAFAYVLEGDEGVFSSSDSSTVEAHNVVVFGRGDYVSVKNTSSSRPLRFLLIAGEPIGEPVVQHGPFVMNSQADIDMTIDDYRNAKNGFEMAKSWRSQ